MRVTLLDAGPLAAYHAKRDQWHEWSVAQMAALSPPLFTCEAVLSEACFLIARGGGDPSEALCWLRRGTLKLALDLTAEAAAIETLMRRYSDMPMSLADACLVRLSELHRDCRVLTVDRDFVRYRRFGRNVIPTVSPW